MDNLKTWYTDRKGKYILFFGFYLIFFVFLAIYIRSAYNNKPKEEQKEQVEEKISTYNISSLIDNDYKYIIDIIDNEEVINFTGTKNNVDYANYPNKYFLDIYNINQLLKRSTFIDSENYILKYKLENKEINDILLTDKEDGDNIIHVYVNNKTEVEKIVLDLSRYYAKDKYQITISYEIGENDENSIS